MEMQPDHPWGTSACLVLLPFTPCVPLQTQPCSLHSGFRRRRNTGHINELKYESSFGLNFPFGSICKGWGLWKSVHNISGHLVNFLYFIFQGNKLLSVSFSGLVIQKNHYLLICSLTVLKAEPLNTLQTVSASKR